MTTRKKNILFNNIKRTKKFKKKYNKNWVGHGGAYQIDPNIQKDWKTKTDNLYRYYYNRLDRKDFDNMTVFFLITPNMAPRAAAAGDVPVGPVGHIGVLPITSFQAEAYRLFKRQSVKYPRLKIMQFNLYDNQPQRDVRRVQERPKGRTREQDYDYIQRQLREDQRLGAEEQLPVRAHVQQRSNPLSAPAGAEAGESSRLEGAISSELTEIRRGRKPVAKPLSAPAGAEAGPLLWGGMDLEEIGVRRGRPKKLVAPESSPRQHTRLTPRSTHLSAPAGAESSPRQHTRLTPRESSRLEGEKSSELIEIRRGRKPVAKPPSTELGVGPSTLATESSPRQQTRLAPPSKPLSTELEVRPEAGEIRRGRKPVAKPLSAPAGAEAGESSRLEGVGLREGAKSSASVDPFQYRGRFDKPGEGSSTSQPIIINPDNLIHTKLIEKGYQLDPITNNSIIEKLNWESVIDQEKEDEPYGLICLLKIENSDPNKRDPYTYLLSDNPKALKQCIGQITLKYDIGGKQDSIPAILDGRISSLKSRDEDY